MRKNQILKIQGTNYKEMTKHLLEQADLESMLPARDKCIGIKPNLVSPSPADYGATTHPEIVAGIIEYLQERGYDNIMVTEGSWVGDKTWESVEVGGYDVLFEKYGVQFRDAQKEKGCEADCGGLMLNLCECVQEIDFLINVPVLKGHCQTKITCALKNLKGLIPNREKRRFHAMGLHKPIAHLNKGIHQDFIVVDHICGDLDFEDGGNPVVRNCIMAACDPVLVDAYACELLHYKVDEVPYVRIAEELGVGCADLAQAEICEWVPEMVAELSAEALKSGIAAKLIKCNPELSAQEGKNRSDRVRNGKWVKVNPADDALPLSRKVVELRDAVEEVESCSACYGYLIPALERLKEEGLLEKLDVKICIGQGYQGQTGKIGIGRCTAGFEHNLKGCPPTDNQIYEFLKAYLSGRDQEPGQ